MSYCKYQTMIRLYPSDDNQKHDINEEVLNAIQSANNTCKIDEHHNPNNDLTEMRII